MPEIKQATEAKVKDLLSYASSIVTIGVDPDNPPEKTRIDFVHLEHRRPICLAIQAKTLRDLANKLDAAHGSGQC